MAQTALLHPVLTPAVVYRFLAYLLLWLVLIGISPANLAIGLFAAAVATRVSLMLLPPAGRRLAPLALAGLALRLPWQSLVAGIDVARRALDPRLPLRPGFVTHDCRLPPGPGRDAFRALMSLQPGALPVSDEAEGPMLIHCLDTDQPVAAQMAAEEALFRRLTRDGGGR